MANNIQSILNVIWNKKTAPWKLKIITDWAQIVGSLHEKVRVEKVYDNTLVLGVYDTCWMQELHLLSNMLISKVNQHIQADHIKKISLKYVQHHEFKKIVIPKQRTVSPQVLTKSEKIVLQKIKDPELKVALQDFLVRCHGER